jgi:hypothetical protein
MHTRHRILIALFFVAFIIAGLETVAVEHSFYWIFWWFDILMHFLGGVWVALLFSWIYLFSLVYRENERNDRTLRNTVIIGVASISFLWEAFEYGVGATMSVFEYYPLDTAIDLAMDGIGALLAYRFFISKGRQKNLEGKRHGDFQGSEPRDYNRVLS